MVTIEREHVPWVRIGIFVGVAFAAMGAYVGKYLPARDQELYSHWVQECIHNHGVAVEFDGHLECRGLRKK